MTKNAQFNSVEITFDGKPCEAIRDALKALRFRWHNVRRVWYGYADEQTTREDQKHSFTDFDFLIFSKKAREEC